LAWNGGPYLPKDPFVSEKFLKLITGVDKIWENIFQEPENSIASFNGQALSTFSQAKHGYFSNIVFKIKIGDFLIFYLLNKAKAKHYLNFREAED
jgi:hypothetical protein